MKYSQLKWVFSIIGITCLMVAGILQYIMHDSMKKLEKVERKLNKASYVPFTTNMYVEMDAVRYENFIPDSVLRSINSYPCDVTFKYVAVKYNPVSKEYALKRLPAPIPYNRSHGWLSSIELTDLIDWTEVPRFTWKDSCTAKRELLKVLTRNFIRDRENRECALRKAAIHKAWQ